MAQDFCGKITLCLIKVRVILIFCTSIGIHKKHCPRLSTNIYDQVNFNRRTSSVHHIIPGQIILDKQVNIHVYSIEVRYLSLMSIITNVTLCTREFTGLSKTVLLLWIIFVILVSCNLCDAVLSVPCGLVVPDLLALLCVVFTCLFVAFPRCVPGRCGA